MAIEWKDNRVVKLDTINVPSGFKKRMKEDHVKELAVSIEREGLANLPVIDDERNLIQGGDRLAALMILGRTKHEVRVATGTKDELRRLLLVENLYRRRGDDYDAMIRELAEIEERKALEEAVEAEKLAMAAEKEAAASGDGKPAKKRKKGRPESAKGVARKRVAKELGTTPEAVRQAQKRGKAKEKAEEHPPGPPPPPVETWGHHRRGASRAG
jgi:ParB-like chromosome segregation protein Spo0J